MATYRIEHREELVGYFYVEANSETDALDEFRFKVNDGQINFSRMEMVNSSDVATDISTDIA